MTPCDLQLQLEDALNCSIDWSRRNSVSNATRSTYFSSAVGQRLISFFPAGTKLFQIGFDDNSPQRKTGEWLLDAVIADLDESGFVRRVHVAMECESSTAMQAFAWDFGKLLNMKSRAKLYLHGLNQSNAVAANALANERLKIAGRLIREHDPETDWFFGFWPSPEKVRGFSSLWDTFGSSTQFDHISRLRLFSFDGASFVPAA